MIDPRRPIPFRAAHEVLGKSKRTLYDWITKGYLTPNEGPEGRTVTLEQLRTAESKAGRVGRPRGTAKRQ